ncbi:unnamed protein product [Pleuronectes platessa]|uniref:Uncharacterized protein n=1 Tax=Pleuronectes platessa TaxID=8262 RepID=A0A9N7V1N6_PLEPL|nr:unnamed protein product [Pleuronectes platessa]
MPEATTTSIIFRGEERSDKILERCFTEHATENGRALHKLQHFELSSTLREIRHNGGKSRGAIYQAGALEGEICPVMAVDEDCGSAVTLCLAGTQEAIRGCERRRARTLSTIVVHLLLPLLLLLRGGEERKGTREKRGRRRERRGGKLSAAKKRALARCGTGQLQKSVSSPLSPFLCSQCYQVATPPPPAHYTGLFMPR